MKKDRELGQAMVEFAMTVLVFFTMIVFILDGGRMMWNYVTVSEAARVGARYAITHGSKSEVPADSAAVREKALAKAPGLDPYETIITTEWENDSNAPGSSVTVTVFYSVQPITTLFWPNMRLTLQDHSTMVIQN